LPLKTPAPLYICTSIKQYNHLTFGGTPLSNNHLELRLLSVGLDFGVVVAAMTKVGDLGRRCWLRTHPLGSMVASLGPRASSRRQ
jgi:hypothetical protein